MRLVLGVATADATLRAFVSSKRDLIVPPEALAKGYLKEARVRISAQILALDHQSTSADLGYWLGRLAGSADALLLLIDKDHRHLVADYEDAYFIAALPEPRGKIIQNYIRASVAPVLRHFATFSQLFDSLNNQRILLLPLDIFLAEEVALHVLERLLQESPLDMHPCANTSCTDPYTSNQVLPSEMALYRFCLFYGRYNSHCL